MESNGPSDHKPGELAVYVHINMEDTEHPIPLVTIYHRFHPVPSSSYTFLQAMFGRRYPVWIFLVSRLVLLIPWVWHLGGSIILHNKVFPFRHKLFAWSAVACIYQNLLFWTKLYWSVSVQQSLAGFRLWFLMAWQWVNGAIKGLLVGFFVICGRSASWMRRKYYH